MGATGRTRQRMTSRVGGIMMMLTLLAATVGISTAAAGQACACSCLPRPAADVVTEAQAVVVGTPVAVAKEGTEARYTFEVQRSYRAEVYRTIAITTSAAPGSCGVTLALNEPRALVLWGGDDIIDPGKWTAGLCDNLNIDAADLEALGAGEAIEPMDTPEPPQTDGGGQPVAGAVALGGVVLVVGGLALWWRRRRRA